MIEGGYVKEVIIYTGFLCRYCKMAKSFFTNKNIKYKEINIHKNPDKKEDMIKLSGGRITVPQIFIGKTHIGGWSELYQLNIGKGLNKILQKEGIK